MKIKKIFHTIFALAAFSAVFCGCSNLFDKDDDDDDSSSEKGRLLFSASSARAASTINPTGFDFSNDSGLTFKLTGTKDWSENLGKWSDSDDGETKAYALMAADTSILVDTGKWTFRLSVTKDEKEILYGNLEKTIVGGNNVLDFGELKEASKDDTTREWYVDVAYGSVELKLSFPARKVKTSSGIFYAVGTDKSDATKETLEITTGDENDSVTFSKKSYLSVGTYIVEISLYTDEKKSLCTKYTALVVVAPGTESKAERHLDSLNALYTVTYELNGGSFASSETIITSYSPVDKFTLPTLTRTGYTFAGWSKSSADATEADYKDGEAISISENTTLYAVWTIDEYKITYVLNDVKATNDGAVESYNVETETFTLPVPATTAANSFFVGWYTTESFKYGTKLLQIAKGSLGDITLYAKWVCSGNSSDGVYYVDASNAAAYIKKLQKNATVWVTGELSEGLLADIASAISASNFLIALDLSNTRGLEKIKKETFSNNANLLSIVIPYSVNNIEEYAFNKCSNLESITIPPPFFRVGILG